MGLQTPPNWVRMRADCNLELIFQALLQIVKRDVGEANKLNTNESQFTYEENTDGVFPLAEVQQTKPVTASRPPSVRFELSKSAIRVNGGGVQFYCRPEWNEERFACKLFIHKHESPYEVWEISQKALIRLFFG